MFLAVVNSGSQAVELRLTGIEAAAVVIALALVAVVLIVVLRKYIANSILGIAVLLIFNSLGLKVAINVFSILICAVFGLLGVALLVLLHFFGISV